VLKREQKEKKASKKNNNEETTIVAIYGEVLINVSYEDECLYTSSHDSDWILDYGASYHATPRKENFISYQSGNMVKVHLGNKSICNIGVEDVLIKIEHGCILLQRGRKYALSTH